VKDGKERKGGVGRRLKYIIADSAKGLNTRGGCQAKGLHFVEGLSQSNSAGGK
jgi:hypothetical protein